MPIKNFNQVDRNVLFVRLWYGVHYGRDCRVCSPSHEETGEK